MNPATLLEHFDRIADAPGAVARLRRQSRILPGRHLRKQRRRDGEVVTVGGIVGAALYSFVGF